MNIPSLNPETIQKILDLFSGVVEGIGRITKKISEMTDRLDIDEEDSTKEDSLPEVIVEKTEFVNLNDIKNIVQAHRPQASDGVAAAMKSGKNKKGQEFVQLYLTYVTGRSIIDSKNNKLIVISAEAFSNEVRSLFGEEQVIILK